MDSSQTASFTGFDYSALRPPAARNPFPVIKGLAGLLAGVNPDAPPDERVARVLGTCAGYAYSDLATVSMMMTRMGLPRNRCVQVSQVVDAMFIVSNAFVVQSRDNEVVILCYRGTQPTSLINWLTDLTIEPTRIRIPGQPQLRHPTGEMSVHGGFYRNVRATRWEIGKVLRRALDRLPIDAAERTTRSKLGPLQALYITGHSLGGAMALLMAVLMHLDRDYAELFTLLKGVYTYGQPMVGNTAFAEACDGSEKIHHLLHRYVYRNDVVPQLPPTEAGDFAHCGAELRYRKEWAPSAAARQTSLPGLTTVVGDFLAQELPALRWLRSRQSLLDHGPEYYIQALTPPGETTEFGDKALGTVEPAR